MEITVEGLTLKYGDNVAVRDLDLDIGEGESVVLLGQSGCGKTSTMRCIAGLETPTTGRITVGDSVLFDAGKGVNRPSHKRNIGMVFQSYAIWPHMTVFENVAFPLTMQRSSKADTRRRVLETLELVGLEEFADRGASMLSGGQMQRVALARSVVMQPSIMLLDEPLSNLDARLRHRLRGDLRELQQRLGLTSVYVTHDQEEALAMSDRIALFRSGNIEQLGTPSEIYRVPVSSYAADFIGAANVLRVTVPQTSAGPAGGGVTVQLGDTNLRGLRRTDLAAGEAYAIARPEHLRLLAADERTGEGATALPGEIVRQQYLGHRQQHRVRLASGAEIETSEPAASRGFSAGERVMVLFPEHETLVMAS